MTFGMIFFRGLVCEFAVFFGRFDSGTFGNLQCSPEVFGFNRMDWLRMAMLVIMATPLAARSDVCSDKSSRL